MPDQKAAQPVPSSLAAVGHRIARAIHRYDHEHLLSVNDIPGDHHRGEADAVLADLKPELDRLAEYENAINWMTTCTSCARVLDSSIRETERAEKAEAEVKAARKFAAEMRDFCSPHGVSVGYADQLIEAMDRAKGTDPETPNRPVPAAYVRLKGQLETDLAQMTCCAAQPPKEGVEEGRIAQQGIAAGTRSSLAWTIHHFEGPEARNAFLKRTEADER